MHSFERQPSTRQVPVDDVLELGRAYERRAADLRVRLAVWRGIALLAVLAAVFAVMVASL